MPKISIILPIYNVELYLKECLDSLINQTLKDIEIICINDKSTDNSLSILKEYANKDNRIIVLEQEINQGPGVARNRGIDIAKGDYIMFCDPDDWYELNACEICYDKISKGDNDIAFFSLNRYLDDTGELEPNTKRLMHFYKYFDLDSINVDECPEYYIPTMFPVTNIYSKNFLNKYNIRFGSSYSYEDHIFTMSSLLHAKKFIAINNILYNYRIRNNSETSKSSQRYGDLIAANQYSINKIYQYKQDMSNNHINIFLKCRIALTLYWYRHISRSLTKKDKKIFYTEIRNFFIEIKNNFDISNLRNLLSRQNYNDFHSMISHPYWHRQIFYVFKRALSYKNHSDGKSRIINFLGFKWKYHKGFWINYQWIKKLWWVFPTKSSRTDFKKICDQITSAQKLDKDMGELPRIQAKIIKRLRGKNQLKVLFLVSENSKWKAQSLYDEMEKSDKFEPMITINIADYQLKLDVEEQKEIVLQNYQLFKNTHKTVLAYDLDNGKNLDLAIFKADIIFYQQPWGISKIQSYIKTSKESLLCYIPYHAPNYGNKWLDTAQPLFKYLFRYYIANEFYKNIFSAWSGLSNIKATGHTMLDYFLNNQERNEVSKGRYIIYAPHHSISGGRQQIGTFLQNGELILEYAKNHPEITWAFKPHPTLKFKLIQETDWDNQKIEWYYNEWEKIAKCCYDSSYIDLFFDSKALITDCGSFLTEYFCTKKPIIHLISNNCQMHPVPPFKKIIDTFYKVYDNDELISTLDRVILQNDDYKKEERLKALEESKLLESNAAKNIINDLEKSIWGKDNESKL
ncbi:glycosyltransferase family 2 protein [Campylobacter lanienae]|uniref:glycosyltransferase family 2 protein n=1 Tax=Campylobacter lanienae TaxID=75658 RepID=UPI000BB43F21|nr:glycosyltransferase [Campylobacter lanienae]